MAFIIDSSGIPDNYSLRTFSKIASASLLPFSMAMSAITWRGLSSGRQNSRGSILCVLDKVVLSLSMYFWTTWTKSQSLTSSQALTSRTSSLNRCGCSAWNLFIFCGSQTNATQTCAVSWNISVPFFLGNIKYWIFWLPNMDFSRRHILSGAYCLTQNHGSQTNATQTCTVSWNISVPFFLGIITNNLTSGNCPSLVKHDGKKLANLKQELCVYVSLIIKYWIFWLSNMDFSRRHIVSGAYCLRQNHGSQTNATQTCAVSWNISVPFFLGIITNNLTSVNCPSIVKQENNVDTLSFWTINL